MPIYPYVCTACGHEFDALQKISDDPLIECPSCSEPTLRKRLAAPAFQLKGTGWYETDFKNSGKSKQSGGKGNDEGKSTGKKDTGGESTGGAKSDSGGGATSSSDSGKSKAAGKDK